MRVRLTPRASKDGIDGLKEIADGACVQARVRAVPEDGKANAALLELLAPRYKIAVFIQDFLKAHPTGLNGGKRLFQFFP